MEEEIEFVYILDEPAPILNVSQQLSNFKLNSDVDGPGSGSNSIKLGICEIANDEMSGNILKKGDETCEEQFGFGTFEIKTQRFKNKFSYNKKITQYEKKITLERV
jgi:hypothetical protein